MQEQQEAVYRFHVERQFFNAVYGDSSIISWTLFTKMQFLVIVSTPDPVLIDREPPVKRNL